MSLKAKYKYLLKGEGYADFMECETKGASVKEADENEVRLYNNAVLHDASGRGDDITVRKFIDAGADVNSLDEDLNTPAHKAAGIGTKHEDPNRGGYIDIIEMLRKAGADLTIPNKKGQTVIKHDHVEEILGIRYGYVPGGKTAPGPKVAAIRR
jgi:ankyrin repeat protein